MNPKPVLVVLLVLVAVAMLISGCSRADYGDKVYDFKELIEDSALVNKNIKVKAYIVEDQKSCTRAACKGPCCNNCTSHLALSSSDLKLQTDKTCWGTVCSMSCDLQPERVYILKGKLTLNNLGMYVFRVAK